MKVLPFIRITKFFSNPEDSSTIAIGYVKGHPTLGNGVISTSRVRSIDFDNGLLRTLNRSYRFMYTPQS